VTVREQRDEHQVDDVVMADDDARNVFAHTLGNCFDLRSAAVAALRSRLSVVMAVRVTVSSNQ
jgi:hypothetical protein